MAALTFGMAILGAYMSFLYKSICVVDLEDVALLMRHSEIEVQNFFSFGDGVTKITYLALAQYTKEVILHLNLLPELAFLCKPMCVLTRKYVNILTKHS
jgi:hypothetical protein